jgi:hypothetical protein
MPAEQAKSRTPVVPVKSFRVLVEQAKSRMRAVKA